MRENVTPTPDERRSRAGDEDTAATTGVRAVGPASRYVLGALLGRGGMADVYRAKDRTLGRDVAVKLMRERTTDTTERARFVAEAQTLARLNHPNLVTILDAGISDEHPFLVLELVVGSSLSTALKQSGRGLPADRVRHIGAQIAAALAHCHAAGIVHRDVKPGNILLGTGGRALLTDFGISRLLDGHAQHTQTGFTIGTASYMAPEQVHGDDLTSAVDLYALGLVMLEACTGRREYEGTPIEAAIARLHRSPRLTPDLPPALAGVLAALTQTDPTRRPSAVDTEHALTSGPPSAWAARDGAGSTPTGTERPGPHPDGASPRRPRRRRPTVFAVVGWAAAALVALAVTLAPTAHTPSPTPSTGSTSRTEKPPTPSASPSPRATPAADVSPGDASQRAASASSGSPASSGRRSSSTRGTTRTATARPSTSASAKKAHTAAKTVRVVKSRGHHGGKNK